MSFKLALGRRSAKVRPYDTAPVADRTYNSRKRCCFRREGISESVELDIASPRRRSLVVSDLAAKFPEGLPSPLLYHQEIHGLGSLKAMHSTKLYIPQIDMARKRLVRIRTDLHRNRLN